MRDLNPNAWGPSYWEILHYNALAVNEILTNSDKENFQKFISVFHTSLPCEKCRKHFDIKLKTYPLSQNVLKSRQSLARWTVDIHNDVNRFLKKPIITFEQFIIIYDKKLSKK
jgi:hypothetical protein